MEAVDIKYTRELLAGDTVGLVRGQNERLFSALFCFKRDKSVERSPHLHF
jgi:hypothetical protein